MKIRSAHTSSSNELEASSSNGGNGGSDHSQTHLHHPITSHKLTGHNYLQWSQSVMMFICGKGKDEYLTGAMVAPAKTDASYKKWNTENSMVMSWLVNSMVNNIGENFLMCKSASEIWQAAKETYSHTDNIAELFGIESTLYDTRQGDSTVTEYFNSLSRLWQRLDMFDTNSWKCTKDGTQYQGILEQKRIFRFLLGLNQSLDEVRGRMLGMKPLPGIREVFSEVRREESRKKIMMSSNVKPDTYLVNPEGSALAARGSQNFSTNDGRFRKGRPWCELE